MNSTVFFFLNRFYSSFWMRAGEPAWKLLGCFLNYMQVSSFSSSSSSQEIRCLFHCPQTHERLIVPGLNYRCGGGGVWLSNYTLWLLVFSMSIHKSLGNLCSIFLFPKTNFIFLCPQKGRHFGWRIMCKNRKGNHHFFFFSSGLVDTLTKTKINADVCSKN